MKMYKARITAASPFSSPLQSDTFFGAFCWNYKYYYGEEELKKLLEKCRSGEESIIFSNAFPDGYLPLPMGIMDKARDRNRLESKEARRQAYQENKKFKRCNLITESDFRRIAQGKSEGYSAGLAKDRAVESEAMHNTVSRELGTTTAEIEGGGLYSITEKFIDSAAYSLYILTDLSTARILPVLSNMFELGIGAKKSTGHGYFTWDQKLEDCTEFFSCEKPNAFVALSNFIPKAEDPTEGNYRLLVKNGKLDREYASSDYPFKKPLLFVESGAVFRTDHVKEWYGRFIKDISVNPDIIVNACTIALPVRIEEN